MTNKEEAAPTVHSSGKMLALWLVLPTPHGRGCLEELGDGCIYKADHSLSPLETWKGFIYARSKEEKRFRFDLDIHGSR